MARTWTSERPEASRKKSVADEMPRRSSPTTSRAFSSRAHSAARRTSSGSSAAVISWLDMRVSRSTFFSLDVHRDLGVHLGVEMHADRMAAQRLEGLVHLDAALVEREVEAAGSVGAIRDVGVGHRAEQLPVLA